MSQERLEKIVSALRSFQCRNVDALLATCTTDVEIDDRLRVDASRLPALFFYGPVIITATATACFSIATVLSA